MYVGNSKTIRRCTDLILHRKSTADIYIARESDDKFEVTAMEPGVAILVCTKKDGSTEKKAVNIKKASSQPRANVSFGFGFGYPGYYYSSDPFYDPYWGWGWRRGWGRPYYGYYW